MDSAKQLQNETRNIYVLEFGVAYFRNLIILFVFSWACNNGLQLTCADNDDEKRLEETNGTWWRLFRCLDLAKYGIVGWGSIWKKKKSFYKKWYKLT